MLGNHRVLCGSALEATAFAVLIRDERAAVRAASRNFQGRQHSRRQDGGD